MRAHHWKRLWRAGRRVFRWCRIAALLLVLGLLCAFLWLNQVGLPGFLKHRIQVELRARGLDLEFARVRLRWYRGIVAEKVSLARAGQSAGPQLTVAETEIRLDPAALRRFEVKVPSVFVRDGKLVWPVSVSNESPREVVAENLTTELSFHPDGTWELEKFTARVNGSRVTLSGSIAHASEYRSSRPGEPTSPPLRSTEAQLRHGLDWMDRIRFKSPPVVALDVRADAREDGGFDVRAKATVDDLATPWGRAWPVAAEAKVRRASGTNSPIRGDVTLRAASVESELFQARSADLSLNFTQSISGTNSPRQFFTWGASGDLTAKEVGSKQASAGALHLNFSARSDTNANICMELDLSTTGLKSDWVNWRQARAGILLGLAPNAKSVTLVTCALNAEAPATQWASADSAKLDFELLPNVGAQTNAAWGLWAKAAPWRVTWDMTATNVTATNLALKGLDVSGSWTAPLLKISHLTTQLYGGQLDGSASLDVPSRRTEAKGKGNFDAWQVAPLFGTNFVKFLSQFHFDTPPKFGGEVAVTLPAWTNSAPDWKGEVLSSLTLAGHVEGGAGSFRGASFTATQVDATFSNRVWFLPQIRAFRPEGRAEFAYTEDTRTRDYAFRGRANIDPQAIRPLLEDEPQRRVLDFFQFTTPPALEGEVRGRWLAPDRIGVNANVAATNFTFRGESAGEFAAQVNYTNEFFRITDARLVRGAEIGTMPFATVDLRAQRLFVTNIQSTIDPMAFTRAIGPQAAEAVAPYRFSRPPSARVHGSISFHEIETTDLHFDISGGPFAWEKFNVPEIRGQIHWVTNSLVLTNVSGDFYGGEMQGDAAFDFSARDGADFHFSLIVADADLHRLIGDLVTPTNKLEGSFNGVFSVASGNTLDWRTWQGFGSARLTNGALWDVPIIGLFSPVLNTIVPGLGNTRAKEAKANFTITNSVIRTGDLIIHSPPARLHYDGTVDFDGRVAARVEAELFRDTILIGPLLSFLTTPLTKVFEYKVAGTLTHPVGEPIYVPKFLLFPLHPFRTLKRIIPGLDETPKPPEKK